MPNFSADDFDFIGKRLAEIKQEKQKELEKEAEQEKTPAGVPSGASVHDEYGCGYATYIDGMGLYDPIERATI